MRTNVLCLVAAVLVGGCQTAPRHALYQVSTIDALLSGVYDGAVPWREVMRHGDFGIGTFDGLGGEMVALDGHWYDVRCDGRVVAIEASGRTPFAAVNAFKPDTRTPLLSVTSLDGLTKALDLVLTATNQPCAIRIDGFFRYVRTRSVPPQHKPYPPLAEVAKQQAEFEFRDVAGTLVGFRCPGWMKGVNVPGYHLHFITADRGGGGHVLDVSFEDLVAQVDTCHTVTIALPDQGDFGAADLNRDRSRELDRVEKARLGRD